MIISIPPRQTANKFSTAFWENFLTSDDINYILDLPEWSKMGAAYIGQPGAEKTLDPAIRSSKGGWMDMNEKNKHIWYKIVNAVANVNANYFQFDLTGCYEPAQLTFYDSAIKNHYNWHLDSSPSDKGPPRKLSMSLLLSDPSEFEGGELQVKDVNDEPVVIEQAKGRAIFFPSYMLHRVTPVTKGVRKSIVLWVGGPEFK